MGKKVTKEVTLGILESIVEGKAEFTNFGPLSQLQIMDIPGFEADLSDVEYRNAFVSSMHSRHAFIISNRVGGYSFNDLPVEANKSIKAIIEKL